MNSPISQQMLQDLKVAVGRAHDRGPRRQSAPGSTAAKSSPWPASGIPAPAGREPSPASSMQAARPGLGCGPLGAGGAAGARPTSIAGRRKDHLEPRSKCP
jgi:hypothetical protein